MRSRTPLIVTGAAIVLAIALVARVAMWHCCTPKAYPDTSTYMDMARAMLGMSHGALNGVRTPVYPALMALCGCQPWIIMFAQMTLGIASALLLYLVGLKLTKSVIFSAIASAWFATSYQQLSFETFLLSETVSTFLLVLTVYLGCQVYERPSRRHVLAFSLAILAALLARPLFLVLLPLGLICIPWRIITGRRQLLAIYTLPLLIGILAWCGVNRMLCGQFCVTTLGGCNLIRHGCYMAAMLPDKYRVIRNAILRSQPCPIPSSNAYDAIYKAEPELTRHGISLLGPEVKAAALYLVIHHPDHYTMTVQYAWGQFWQPETIPIPHLSAWNVLPYGWMIALFGLACLLLVALPFLRITLPRPLYFVVITVLVSSLVQALLEIGENSRYAIPFLPLIIISNSVYALLVSRTIIPAIQCALHYKVGVRITLEPRVPGESLVTVSNLQSCGSNINLPQPSPR